ncbi:MAG TPA: hypothetical protein VFG87_13550 [Amycolatopsis sp.]|nr:hypothetical protein [Amycolatopsis sp.]
MVTGRRFRILNRLSATAVATGISVSAVPAQARQSRHEPPIPYFRAPYGSRGQIPQVAAALGRQPLGRRPAVGDRDMPGPEVIVRRRREGITPGGVVLRHDGGGDRGQTISAVARIVPGFRADGWHFTRPVRRG